MNQRQIEASIIRFHTSSGSTTELGFHVGNGRVLTTVHAVARVLALDTVPASQPDATLTLSFLLAGKNQKAMARIVVWHTAKNVAGLELLEPVPENAQFVQLFQLNDLNEHAFRAYSMKLDEKNDLLGWIPGMIEGQTQDGRFYIEEGSRKAIRIDTTFSGAPVWDEELDAIVGMITADEETAFVIPTAEIAAAWPDLPIVQTLGLLHKVPPLPTPFLSLPADQAILQTAVLKSPHRPVVLLSHKAQGGTGKTVLTTALVRDHEARQFFPDGIFWLSMGPSPNLLALQAQLAMALTNEDYVFSNLQAGQDRLRELLAGKSCLIVLDDVWQATHAQAFDIQDTDYQAHLLVTTRNKDLGIKLGAEVCELHPLSEEQAMGLLAAWMDSSPGKLPVTAVEIAWLGAYLPLSLSLYGAQIRDGVDWEDLVEAIQELEEQFLEHPEATVMKAIWLAREDLTNKESEPYLALAAFPPNQWIPETAVFTLWNHVSGTTKRKGRQLIDKLLSLRLLETRGESPRRWILLHGLIHRHLLEVAENVSAVQKNLLEAYQSQCHDGWANGPDDGYFFQNLPYHLAQAGRQEELERLLLDFDWLQVGLNSVDLSTLVASYDLLTNKDKKSAPRQVQALLRSLAPRLLENWVQASSLLAEELINTFTEEKQPALGKLLTGAAAWRGSAWLRPLTSRPSTPGRMLARTLRGHTDGVTDLAITSDGNFALSASDDRTIKMWDISTGRVVRSYRGHSWAVTAVKVMPDGKMLTASWDGTLKVWDLESGDIIYTLKGHGHMIHDAAITSDGQNIVSASLDKTLRVWDMKTRYERQIVTDYTPSANAVAVTPDGQVAISDLHKALRVWDTKTGEEQTLLRGHAHLIADIQVTHDGRFVISGSFDETLKVWELETGQTLHTLRGHKDRVNALAITPDNMYVVSASEDRTLRVWHMENGQNIATFKAGDSLRACAVAPDGVTIVAGDQSGRVYFLRLELPVEA